MGGQTLEITMRQLLLELSLTSNGRSGAYGGRSTGGDGTVPIPTLGVDDAPQLYFAAAWDRAQTSLDRARVVDQALETLQGIRRSSGFAQLRAETKEDKRARIVEYGEELEPYEVAVAAGCTATFVREARRLADRDEERGRPNREGRSLKPERRLELVLELRERGLSGRQIARHLRISYSTVARDLGWKE